MTKSKLLFAIISFGLCSLFASCSSDTFSQRVDVGASVHNSFVEQAMPPGVSGEDDNEDVEEGDSFWSLAIQSSSWSSMFHISSFFESAPDDNQ